MSRRKAVVPKGARPVFLERERALVDGAIARLLQEHARGPARHVYDMQRYSFGYLDEQFERQHRPVGKRFRSALCLYLAQAYGNRAAALDAALAIELFHNTSLIYDDIQDNDEYRRGRKTLWRLAGLNDALNAGGTGSMLVGQQLARVAQQPKSGGQLAELLAATFLSTWEGQYLDTALAQMPLSRIREREYLRMIDKKTAQLISAAAVAAGIAGHAQPRERVILGTFGRELGLAYQIANDYASLWGSSSLSGKDAHGDLRQRKRTLPLIRAYARARRSDARRLEKLYALGRPLSEREIAEVLRIIERTDAREATASRIETHVHAAVAAAEALALPKKVRRSLGDYARSLVPVV